MFKNVLAAHVQTRIAQALAVVIRAITAAAVITIVTVAVSDLVRHVHAHQDHAHHAHVHLDLVHHVHAVGHIAEGRVLAVQMRAVLVHDKELGTGAVLYL